MSEAKTAGVQMPAQTVMSGTPRRGGVVERGLLIGGEQCPGEFRQARR
jgi:hypothetical protein